MKVNHKYYCNRHQCSNAEPQDTLICATCGIETEFTEYNRLKEMRDRMNNKPLTISDEQAADKEAQTYQRTAETHRTPYRAFKEGYLAGIEHERNKGRGK